MNNEKRSLNEDREVRNGTERPSRRFERNGYNSRDNQRRGSGDDVNRYSRPVSAVRRSAAGRREFYAADRRFSESRTAGVVGKRRFSEDSGRSSGERTFNRERPLDRGNGGYSRETRPYRKFYREDRDGRSSVRDERRSARPQGRFYKEEELEPVNGDGFVPRGGYRTQGGYQGFKSRAHNTVSFSTGDRIRKAYDDNSQRVYSKKKQNEFRSSNPFADNDQIRLNRYIAISGICSRREADELIQRGSVTVNGEVVTTLGVKVNKNDVVEVDGKTAVPERKVYILLNKPKDFVTTVDDPQERKTVMHLIEGACRERVYPVGRLDRQTTGVLLFTNDGDLAKKLTHPSYEHKKVYHVFLDRPLDLEDMQKISDGIELEDGVVAADDIQYTSTDRTEVGIEIHSGKNRIVRRIFEYLGYNIQKLDRVYFAGLTKKDLPRGKWRFLTAQEVNYIKNFNV